METTTSPVTQRNVDEENFVLSVWPSDKSLSTIDPNCLAASLWLRAQGFSYSMVNTNHPLSLIFGAYPTLFDKSLDKHFVGFDSIYEHSRSVKASADELALLATFQRLFIPAFMHSQWLDDKNKTSSRTLFHYTIGLPTSFLLIRKKIFSAECWYKFATLSNINDNERSQQIYADAERCLKIFDDQLKKAEQRFLIGEKFSLIDAWVSAYLLIVLRHGSDQSVLNRMIKSQRLLFKYVQRISEEENLQLTKQRDIQSRLSITDAENSSRVASILHVLSQVVSFSIFIFMLTKIGADSYANSSS